MSAADEWAVPLGYRRLADVVQEHGRDHVQTKLISGEWSAFEFDIDTGNLGPIPTTFWYATHGRWRLDRAENPDDADGGAIFTNHWFIVVVRMSEQQQKQRATPQGDRVDQAIAKLYPSGTNGIPSKAVWQKVADELRPESKKLGFPIPSLTTVKRKLGRRK